MKKVFDNLFFRISVVAVLFIAFGIMLAYSAKTDSLTSDEPVHISAGYLKTYGDFRFNFEHPPLINYLSGWSVRLLVNPQKSLHNPNEQYAYGDDFLFLSGNNAQDIIFAARIPVVILSLLLALVIFLWARRLWGYWGGVIALTLTVFCPTMLAHGHLATTDMGSVFFLVLSMYVMSRFVQTPNIGKVFILAIVLGLTLAAKHSTIIILPIAYLIFLVSAIAKKINWKQFIGYAILTTLVALAVLWFCYFLSMYQSFSWHPQPYTMYDFLKGKIFSNWYTQLIFMPIDYYWRGLVFVKHHAETGHMSYLNGEFKIEGWWYYFPLAFWYKTLIPTMILFALSIFAMIKIRAKYIAEEFLIFLLPIIYFITSMTTKLDIGVRHIMIIYPFIYLSIGRLAKIYLKNKMLNLFARLVIIGLIFWAIAESIYYYPNDIAYFNQVAGGPQNGYQHLSDSNVDWGQDLGKINAYMNKKGYNNYTLLRCDESPRYDFYQTRSKIMGDKLPLDGDYVAIRVWCFHLPKDSSDPIYQKIKEMKPIDNVGYSILIYKIK